MQLTAGIFYVVNFLLGCSPPEIGITEIVRIGIAFKRKFAPIVPDFVLELRSNDQSLPALREKMEEYIACGCRLGWLVDPQNRCTYVYFENGDIQTVSFDDVLRGGYIMSGLEIRMGAVIA